MDSPESEPESEESGLMSEQGYEGIPILEQMVIREIWYLSTFLPEDPEDAANPGASEHEKSMASASASVRDIRKQIMDCVTLHVAERVEAMPHADVQPGAPGVVFLLVDHVPEIRIRVRVSLPKDVVDRYDPEICRQLEQASDESLDDQQKREHTTCARLWISFMCMQILEKKHDTPAVFGVEIHQSEEGEETLH